MVGGIIVAIVLLPAFLTTVWFVEILAGCLTLGRQRSSFPIAPHDRSYRTAVLIPAHNEGRGVLPTIGDVQAQLKAGDRILVVADNCSDDTAEIARAAGVEVIVRNDPQRRGKGYALEFGVQHLSSDPPDVVIILDADCHLGDDALRHLSESVMSTGRPAQASYFMLELENARSGSGMRVFAWRVKNLLRPLGLRLLGLPTQLFGTGMAFPFALLADRDLGNSRLAEDTALGIALAAAGYAPVFANQARIHSYFPVSQAATEQQRQRWEKGHLDNIADLIPGALAKSLKDRNLALAVLAIDLAVPPLSLLALMTIVCAILGGLAFALNASAVAVFIPVFSGLLLLFGTTLAWIAVGRDVLSIRSLLLMPLHLVKKAFFYHRLASGKAPSSWIRTDRK